MSSTEYTPKSILLTGGAGFIGSNVMLHIMKHYPHYKMICLDKLDSCSSLKNFEEVMSNPNFTFVKGDCCSADLVAFVLDIHHVDTIIHFAAQTHVDNSFGNSIRFTECNVLATHTLLEVCKQFSGQIKRFIHVSTDEVYGEVGPQDDLRMTEDHQLNPSNPYAATKVGAEYVVKSYHASFGLPTIITRSNNVYGPRQFPEKLIPKFTLLLSKGRPCPIHGSGEQRRSFIHVDDVSTAFDVVLHKGAVGSTYNIGSEEEFTNVDTFKNLIAIMRRKYPNVLDPKRADSEYIYHVRDRAFNDFRYRIDCGLMHSLGWKRTKTNFQKGLEETVEWYLSNPNHWPAFEFALQPHPFQLPGGVAAEDGAAATTLQSVNGGHINSFHSKKENSLKWLLFGGNGWLGGNLQAILKSHRPHDEVVTASSRADDEVDVEAELRRVRPDRVISLVGRTHGPGYSTIDYLEQKGKITENVRDNLYSPLVLLTLCNRLGIHLTYMGTGCIFKYDDSHRIGDDPSKGFTNDDRPNFFGSSYSSVKGFTDRLFHLIGGNALNVRIRMPITADRNPRNFITKITTYAKICSVENSMSVIPELFPIMVEMAVKKETGTVNLSNPGYITHNRILELYKEIVNPEFKWQNFSIEEQSKILAADRSNNCLNTERLQKFAPHVMSIEQSVVAVLNQIKKNDIEAKIEHPSIPNHS